MPSKTTLGIIVAAALASAGCSQTASNPSPAKNVADHGHTHDSWWCNEHGVPEEVCAQCNVKLVAHFKEKGDWCKEHELPDSQCFTCHPEKQKEFAAQYEAKYGKQPPKPESTGEKHDHKHEAKEKT